MVEWNWKPFFNWSRALACKHFSAVRCGKVFIWWTRVMFSWYLSLFFISLPLNMLSNQTLESPLKLHLLFRFSFNKYVFLSRLIYPIKLVRILSVYIWLVGYQPVTLLKSTNGKSFQLHVNELQIKTAYKIQARALARAKAHAYIFRDDIKQQVQEAWSAHNWEILFN